MTSRMMMMMKMTGQNILVRIEESLGRYSLYTVFGDRMTCILETSVDLKRPRDMQPTGSRIMRLARSDEYS